MPQVRLSGPALCVATCARRLAPLGWQRTSGPDPDSTGNNAWVEGVTLDDAGGLCGVVEMERHAALGPIDCRITWSAHDDADPEGPSSEAIVQAAVGLMHLHGLEAGIPRRLGLEVASVAAGMVAAQGVLAAVIGCSRGTGTTAVTTSVIEAGALLISQYIARAGCGEGDPQPPALQPDAVFTSPFPTADGAWVEIETLEPRSWGSFWHALGVPWADVVDSWRPFSLRYSTAVCALPATLPEAGARLSLAAISGLARTHGVSLCAVRDYDQVAG
ncbi:MAG: CoA transferase, partial [Candidatus Dormibacteria bacterium]